jgi:Domain of unknown function (DUF1330)
MFTTTKATSLTPRPMGRSSDYETAMACYRSPEYQENIKRRQPHSIADLIVVEGYDGPQP